MSGVLGPGLTRALAAKLRAAAAADVIWRTWRLVARFVENEVLLERGDALTARERALTLAIPDLEREPPSAVRDVLLAAALEEVERVSRERAVWNGDMTRYLASSRDGRVH